MERGTAAHPTLQTDSNTYSAAQLPIELVIPILTEAVESSHKAACAISLVSTWCRQIALPHLFAVLSINPTFRPAHERRQRLTGSPPDIFPPEHGPRVRALWAATTRLSDKSVRSIFDACRAPSDLALTWDRFRDLSASRFLFSQPALPPAAERGRPHPPALHYPRPHVRSPVRALTVLGPWVAFVWRDDALATRAGCSLFLQLTHLRVPEFEPRTLPLGRLPNLTHLAVAAPRDLGRPADGPRGVAAIPGAMESEDAPRILMVVLTVDADTLKLSLDELRAAAMDEDDRLHVVHAPPKLAVIRKEWETAARGGESIWERAARERSEWLENDIIVSIVPSCT